MRTGPFFPLIKERFSPGAPRLLKCFWREERLWIREKKVGFELKVLCMALRSHNAD